MDFDNITALVGAAGVASSSVFFALNHTINMVAFPLVFMGKVPKSNGQPASSRFFIPATDTSAAPVDLVNRQWKEVYERGFRAGTTTAIISAAAFFGAAYSTSASGSDSKAPYLFIAAALSQISTGPYTWFVIAPTNNVLHRRADEIGRDETPTVKPGESDTLGLIKKWLGMNNIRANLAGLSICLGIAGLVVSQM